MFDYQENLILMVRGSRWASAPSHQVKKILGLNPKAKLPKEGLPLQHVAGFDIWVKPLNPATSANHAHRVYLKCPACGKTLSAGRIGQHVNTVHLNG